MMTLARGSALRCYRIPVTCRRNPLIEDDCGRACNGNGLFMKNRYRLCIVWPDTALPGNCDEGFQI
jgi:hypothetical protein